MPIERKAWACKWKCGGKVSTNRKRMVSHEARCFRNPDRRACQTCSNHTTEYETVYNPNHGGDPGSTDYDVKVPYCNADDTIDLRQGPRCDCPLWSNAAADLRRKENDGHEEKRG